MRPGQVVTGELKQGSIKHTATPLRPYARGERDKSISIVAATEPATALGDPGCRSGSPNNRRRRVYRWDQNPGSGRAFCSLSRDNEREEFTLDARPLGFTGATAAANKPLERLLPTGVLHAFVQAKSMTGPARRVAYPRIPAVGLGLVLVVRLRRAATPVGIHRGAPTALELARINQTRGVMSWLGRNAGVEALR